MQSDAMELARTLIACASVTPNDAGCQTVIAQRLSRIGFTNEAMRFGSVDNLWARRGSNSPLLCFAGHTDVVPPGPRELWTTEPFTPTLRDGNLFGRGAADMKSSLAAFVTAVERFVTHHPAHGGSIAMLLTSDEEGPALDGTVRVVETLAARGERIDFCVVGEPTSTSRLGDTIKNGRRGSLSGDLTVHGLQGHVAYPHLAKNPVHLFAPALAELTQIEWDRGDEFFPPTTWQVSNVHAGTGAGNVIPGELKVLFNFRFSPASSAEQLKRRLTDVLDSHRLTYSIDWSLSANPFLTPRGRLVNAVNQAVHAVTGIEPTLSTSGGTSDARFIIGICPEVVELGPINASIHSVNEHIAARDVDALTEIYLKVLTMLLDVR